MKKKKTTTKIRPMEARYQRLKAKLARLGPILVGTITPRVIEREDPQQPGVTKTYGPYYQWTFKQEGKTVTQNLTAKQARVYQKAIDNQRKMEQILAEMRTLSLAILEENTEGVIKRKSGK